MILRDEITVKTLVTVGWDSHGEEITEEVERGPLPAHVGRVGGSADWSKGTYYFTDEMQAIIGPDEQIEAGWPSDITIWWRGKKYRCDAILPVSRAGATHHITLKLTRV